RPRSCARPCRARRPSRRSSSPPKRWWRSCRRRKKRRRCRAAAWAGWISKSVRSGKKRKRPLSGGLFFALNHPPVIAGLDPAIHDAEMSGCWLYILASKPRGTLYVGVTNNLVRRIYEHQNELVEGFTKQYAVKMLVYYERHDSARTAIQREKNIKHWSRQWKIELIEGMNPVWRDLTNDIVR